MSLDKFVKVSFLNLVLAKWLQRLLIFCVLGVSFYFTGRLAHSFWRYYSLKEIGLAQISQWEIEEKEDRFTLKAKYSFKSQEKIIWISSYKFAQKYLSHAAALAALKEKAKKTWDVWYRSDNPSFSSLEKEFPANLLCRTVLCYGIVIYFIFINRKIDLLR